MTNKIFRAILGIAVLGFFIWILNFNLIFLGRLVVANDFVHDNSFISNINGGLIPVKEIGTNKIYQEVRSVWSSIDFFIPSKTQTLNIQIKGVNPTKQLVYGYKDHLGVNKNFILQDEGLKRINWNIKNIDEYTVLYDPEAVEPYDINGLIFNKKENVRSYYASDIFDKVFFEKIDSWQEKNYSTEVDLPLRGDHYLTVYVGNDGILDLEINYQQKIILENRVGREKIGFGVLLGLPDEEVSFNKNSNQEKDVIKIYKEGLNPGGYNLILAHDNDITVDNIVTHNPFSLIEEVIVNNPENSLDLQTNSQKLSFYTVHGTGQQKINVGEEEVEVIVKQKTKNSKELSNLTRIIGEYADFEVSGEINSKFIPTIFGKDIIEFVLGNSELVISDLYKEDNNIEYIIFRSTDYFLDSLNQNDQTTEFDYSFNIDLEDAYINDDNDQLSLNLIIPGGQFKAEKIKATYYRNFWDYLRNYSE